MADLFDEAAGRRLERSRRSPSGSARRTLDGVRRARSTWSGRAGRSALAIEADRVPSFVLYGPPGQRQDDAGAHRGGRHRRRVRRALGRVGDRRERPRGARRRPRAARRDRAGGRSSSSTRSTASTRRSRTPCCPASRTGIVTLIGATTENPYFELNSALLSRMQVYELEALTGERAARDRPARRRRARGRARPGGRGADRGAGRRRRAERARDPRAGRADGGPRARSRPPTSRMPPASGRSSTTGAATVTTTRSRPGSSRPARATCRRRSTTWP